MTESQGNAASLRTTTYAELRRRMLFFAALFSLFVITTTAFAFASLRSSALRSAEAHAQSYSDILSDHLARTVSAIDARLMQLALQSERLGGPGGADGPWLAVLEAARGRAEAIGSLSVTDAQGVIRHSTIRALVGRARGDRFIYRALTGPNAGGLISDEPLRSSFNGRLMLPFGRRLNAPDGRLQGAIVATFYPEALRDFYRSVDTQGGLVRIIHTTGAVVMQEPGGGSALLAASDPILNTYHRGRRSGVFDAPVTRGGPAMITAFSAVGGTGLLISVSLEEGRALAAWRNDALVAGGTVLAALVAFWVAVLLMLRQLQAREAAECELIAQQVRFAEAQRLEALGQLTGGVAHDFNNLLTIIINSADSILMRVSEELRPRVEAILYAADNGAALVRQLLSFSRRQTLLFAAVDINLIVGAMEDMLRRTLGARVETEFTLAADLWPAYADRTQVESALLNLAINARDAMPNGGTLTIETYNAHLDEAYAAQNVDVTPGEYVVLAVTDSGVGMAPEVIERAFEPFFTTKEVGKGSGMGLSMVYGFAKQSKGHVKIYSELGRGTTVRLYLPRDATGLIAARPTMSTTSERGSETILVVEDDPRVRQLAVSSLRERGYTVREAANGAEAVAELDGEGKIDLLLTDVIMPGSMTGRDVAEHALEAQPSIRLLFTSGYADASVMRNGLVKAGARFLAKPYRGGELAAAVRALLDSTEVPQRPA
jgi:signal transduction histidine kinase/ActR/RegA family two-component response regulator